MKIKLIYIGKTSKKFLIEGEQEYLKRLKHYCSIDCVEIQDIKNQKSLSFDEIKKAESEKFLAQIHKNDTVFLLDEKGKQHTSVSFAEFLSKHQLHSSGEKLIFIIGGAFGFSDEVYARANGKISLSSLTFSHQMIRMIFLEQVYRALTILKGEKYHHA